MIPTTKKSIPFIDLNSLKTNWKSSKYQPMLYLLYLHSQFFYLLVLSRPLSFSQPDSLDTQTLFQVETFTLKLSRKSTNWSHDRH